MIGKNVNIRGYRWVIWESCFFLFKTAVGDILVNFFEKFFWVVFVPFSSQDLYCNETGCQRFCGFDSTGLVWFMLRETILLNSDRPNEDAVLGMELVLTERLDDEQPYIAYGGGRCER